MQATGVINFVDKPWQLFDDVGKAPIVIEVDMFALERLHEAFGLGVVVGVTPPAHRTAQAQGGQGVAIEFSGILSGFKRSSQHLV